MYCIDTSAILHGWNRDYPPDVFPSIWFKLTELDESGQLIAPTEVLLELKRRDDIVYEWAKELANTFIESDERVQQIVSTIVNDFPNFTEMNSIDGIWADPYVIAIAIVNNAIVVTGEKRVGDSPSRKKIKIPNICEDLNIEYTNFLGLIRKESWQFK